MIQFSCADFTFPTLPHERVLQLLSLMDFKLVEVGIFQDRSHLQPADQFDLPEKRGAMLRASTESHGLSVGGIFLQNSLDFHEFAINHPNVSIREKERDTFKRAIDYTLAAGSRHFTGLPGCDFNMPDTQRICCEELMWRVEYSASMGTVYAVEPHIGSLMEIPEKALEILKMVKGLTIALDHSHYIYSGVPLDRIRPLTRYASVIHARGAAKGEPQTSFEKNETDFSAIANHLKEVEYSGTICMEYCYLRWENLNRTDNISETMKLRQYLASLIGIDVMRTNYQCG